MLRPTLRSIFREIMPTRTNTISRFTWRGPTGKKPRQSTTEPSQPLDYIADAFRHYIRNEMPARLIDTSNLMFVERSAIFSVFFSEIAQITEDDIERRIRAVAVDMHPEAGIYINPLKTVLQETIRNVVQYAIFSHRWTDSEPSYQDVLALSGGFGLGRQRNSSAGLVKLVHLCKTARSLGYKLVWSDTCCIDETNTAERSEAIHAMFRWYAQAHLCIVHLGASLSFADFWCEPWFTRGWTLQELLAPRRIKFYDKTWRPFTVLANDKSDNALMSTLSTITGIPWDVVVADNSRGIKGHGVWEIMSWASTRKTTRIEDTSYCLYGLFDVNIPVTYGEGAKAFPRLLEAIVARYPTWDVFAWAGQASERHPALPCSPGCYPRWDGAMTNGGAGMTEFALTPHGLRLMSVPLIPMVFVSEAKETSRTYSVTLRPRPGTAGQLGVYSDVTVVCGTGRLRHIRDSSDLHACILNYRPGRQGRDRGELEVGKTYVCFLLHMGGGSAERSTWLKVATENVLLIVCQGAPTEQSRPERTCGAGGGVFSLGLKTTHIRAPSQSNVGTQLGIPNLVHFS